MLQVLLCGSFTSPSACAGYSCALLACCHDPFGWVFASCADDGISIPYKYTSSLAPIMTSKLWNDVKVRGLVAAAFCLDGLNLGVAAPLPPLPPGNMRAPVRPPTKCWCRCARPMVT